MLLGMPFTLEEWLQRILEFFFICATSSKVHIYVIVVKCLGIFLQNMAVGCSLMIKVILLSCHRISMRTPNLFEERVKKLSHYFDKNMCSCLTQQTCLNLGTFMQALNLHKQNSEFPSATTRRYMWYLSYCVCEELNIFKSLEVQMQVLQLWHSQQ